MSDVTFDMQQNDMNVHHRHVEPWKVTLINTGLNTNTGGRLKRVQEYIKDENAFCFTYGDGLADVNITELLSFHQRHGKWATVTAVQPPGRYGALDCEGENVRGFVEKPKGDGGLINGGFFVLKPDVLELISGDTTDFEYGTLAKLALMNQMKAFRHSGFWQPMDTLRDKNSLNELWETKKAPWKVW